MGIELPEIIAHIQGNRFIGLSVYFTDEGFEAVGCEVLKEKGDLKISRQFRFYNEFELLRQYVTGSFPLVLSIDGNGILHKKIEATTKFEAGSEMNFFPGIDVNSFYLLRTVFSSGESYLSVGRKEKINTVVTELKNSGFYIIGITLGPFIMDSFLNIIESNENRLILGRVELKIHQKSIQSYERCDFDNTSKYCLQQEIFQGDILLPFCLVMASVTGMLGDENSLQIPGLEDMRIQNLFKKRLFRFLALAVVGIFFVLGLNFILYSAYSQDFEELLVPYNQNEKVLDELMILENKLEEKRLFMQENNLTGNSDKAWYCDRMGALIVDGVELERMEIFPVAGKLRESKKIRYSQDVVRIEGVSVDEIALRSLIGLLEEENWVNEIVVEKYIKAEENPISFSLKIGIND